MLRRFVVGGLWAALLGAPVASAGLYQDLYQGLDYFTRPTGGPIIFAQDGTRVNGARTGRLRIVPNQLGQGYELQLDRTFGVDSRGRPEVLNIGPAELQLSGQVQSTLGYTRRGFMSASASTNANNLQYQLRTKTGLQDATLNGTLNLQSALDINQLGFYTLNLNVSNTNSSATFEGLSGNQQVDTDFDVGPIAVQGNLLYDGALSLLSSVGADTSQLSQATPESPIDRITRAIQDSIKANAAASGISLTPELEGEISDLSTSLTAGIQQTLATALQTNGATLERGDAQSNGALVPEPGTLVLMSLGGLGVWRMRRRGV